MIETHADILTRWAQRKGQRILATQRNGKLHYFAMAGRQNTWVCKKQYNLQSHSIFQLRRAMRDLLALWRYAYAEDLKEHEESKGRIPHPYIALAKRRKTK